MNATLNNLTLNSLTRADDPSTPPEILKGMAINGHRIVKEYVAKNPSATIEILEILIADNSAPAAQMLAVLNPKLPVEILQRLTERPDGTIRDLALKRLAAAAQS